MTLGPAHLLTVYDEQLRTDAETTGAVSVARHGPLWLVTSGGGRGFVTYRDLGGADAGRVRELVRSARTYYGSDPTTTRVEWKARGHDVAPGLADALAVHGFAPGEEETVVLGEAAALAVDVALPEGVALRRVTSEVDVRAATAMQDAVFGDPVSPAYVDDLLQRLAAGEGTEPWVAEAAGQVVGAGRLEPVAGCDVAGLWGGATSPAWRRRGVYRALVAERARSALRQGKTLLHSDCSPRSRPVLERAGLRAVTTTTPWTWRRTAARAS